MNRNITMGSLLRSDFYKLGKLKSIYIAPAIMVLLVLIQYAVLWLEMSFNDGASIPSDEILLSTILVSGKSLLFSCTSLISLSLFIAIIGGIFIGGEFSNGTIKLNIARGADRVKIYFSKWLVMITLAFAYCLFALLICGILTAASGYGESFTAGQFGLLIRAFALQFIVHISTVSIFVMLDFLSRSSGAAIGISLGVEILLGIVVSILAVIGVIAENSALIKMIDYLPSQQMTSAVSFGALSAGEAARTVLVPIAYAVISTLIGVFTFLKRDIK